MDTQKADEYFAGRLRAGAWVDAGDMEKLQALTQADRQLTPYRGKVDRTTFFRAVCEQALWLLQGDKRGELQRAGVKSFSAGNISEQFDAGGRSLSIAPQAWTFIQGVGVKGGQIR
jgi:hypothetical protein